MVNRKLNFKKSNKTTSAMLLTTNAYYKPEVQEQHQKMINIQQACTTDSANKFTKNSNSASSTCKVLPYS